MMKQEKRQGWAVVAVLVAVGCACAAAASLCRTLCRIPYLSLGAPASSPQAA